MNLAEHRIPASAFDELASGAGSRDSVERLKAAQRSRHLLLLRGVLETTRDAGHGRWPEVRRAYDLLASVQAAHPEAVNAVLHHPSVGAWARHTIQTLETPEQMSALAAAAALRARFACDLDVSVVNGVLNLPSLGQLTVGPGVTTVTVHCSADGAEVSTGGRFLQISEDEPGWRPLRHLSARAADEHLDVLIDDLDPHRMPGSGALRDPLTPQEAGHWQGLLDDGWDLLVRNHLPMARQVSAAISVFTPLSPPPSGMSSATSRETFGCIAMSTPPDAHALAVTLAHETQHAKLSALLDIVPLTKPDDGSRHYAPWRPDPRPAAGLLQGTYAYVGVTEFWERQRHHESGESEIRANAEFARWRSAARLVARTLLDSGALTEPGVSFVSGMAMRLEEWAREPVPAAAATLAEGAADRHRSLWRERNARDA
ncbi:HEXXH motif domain-containing protein [Nonomuraea gerenzanensis]|uniref:Transcriptional regulator n=1 Tax=Nonomuraea gerenzanensis TaxID=93944 RepID=A0A1M4DXQ5_9ACTN|nr:HEXXH motif domain-containing protein [Nonomuraea gerenzanensis]UBU13644.1 HEXXH motif domain-containing protein [Nonomuraea gerenzanensis]SBO91310.1 Transcriptional regulator [Nonomuraea gerenzanensis]